MLMLRGFEPDRGVKRGEARVRMLGSGGGVWGSSLGEGLIYFSVEGVRDELNVSLG